VTGAHVRVGPLLIRWTMEVLPGCHVDVVVFGCRIIGAPELEVSSEHQRLQLFDRSELEHIPLPRGYKTAIDLWGAREQRSERAAGD